MPDNQRDGKLESFLNDLVDTQDRLIDHATSETNEAKRLGAEFSDTDHLKARLHAWLAWQQEPGRPFGTAVRARYLRHDSPAAEAFVAWFKKLHRLM